MHKRFTAVAIVVAAVLILPSSGFAQTWSFPGISNEAFAAVPAGGPAPRRDLTGLWDPGQAGIAGGEGYFVANPMAPFTALGEKMMLLNKPTHGPRSAKVAEGNDPLTTGGDPSGFPRIVNYELRPVRIVHTPIAVLMLYSFNQTWRVILTDGRKLPDDPDPRWFGYSVGRWEDDQTFVIDTVGMDDRTWVDSGGRPHSTSMRVEERYRRASENVLEMTVTINDPLVYTKPWLSRNRMPFKRLPVETDVLEMIYAASEARAYKDDVASQTTVK